MNFGPCRGATAGLAIGVTGRGNAKLSDGGFAGGGFFFLLQPALIAARRCSHMVGGAWFHAPLHYLLAALFAVGACDRGQVERGGARMCLAPAPRRMNADLHPMR